MPDKECSQCGAPIAAGDKECKYCGAPISAPVPPPPVVPQPSAMYQQGYQQQMMNDGINPMWPIKNKVTAGILAILLGGLGIHKFYLGKTGAGILSIIFCWTYIPSIIGIVEGITYLTQNDHNFQVKNHVRLY